MDSLLFVARIVLLGLACDVDAHRVWTSAKGLSSSSNELRNVAMQSDGVARPLHQSIEPMKMRLGLGAHRSLLKSLATSLLAARPSAISTRSRFRPQGAWELPLRIKLLLKQFPSRNSKLRSGQVPLTSLPLIRTTYGRTQLEPQPIPTILREYHEKSIALSELALRNRSVHCTRHIRYGEAAHQTLDVWAPARRSRNLPIVLGIHGGGWEVGYPEWAGFLGPQVCSSQALYITPAYTLANFTHRAWPSSRDDLLQALRWIVQNAKSYGGDPTRIILTGHSAGGHLASCLGLNPDVLQDAGISPKNIKALFLVSCPVGLRAQDFTPKQWLWRLWVGRPFLHRLYRRILPGLRPVLGDPPDPVIAKEASPLANIDAVELALLPDIIHITYGEKGDFPLCKIQAELLRAKLNSTLGGPRVEILKLPSNHFETHYELANDSSPWYTALRQAIKNL